MANARWWPDFSRDAWITILILVAGFGVTIWLQQDTIDGYRKTAVMERDHAAHFEQSLKKLEDKMRVVLEEAMKRDAELKELLQKVEKLRQSLPPAQP